MIVQRSDCEDPSLYRCGCNNEIVIDENYYLVPTLVLGGCAFMGVCAWAVASATIFKNVSLDLELTNFSDAELEDNEKRDPVQQGKRKLRAGCWLPPRMR